MSTLGAFWRFKEMGVFLLFYNNVLKNTKFTFDGSSLLLILLTVKNVKSKMAIKRCFLSFQKIMFFLSFSSYSLLLFSPHKVGWHT